MSTPDPEPTRTPAPPQASAVGKKPLVVVSRFSRRDIIVMIAIVIALVGFILLAIYDSTKPPKNMLKGVIRGKSSTGEREMLIEVRPRKGVTSKTEDTGYYLKVFVPEENREYTVIVEKELWEKKKEGEPMEFLRPPNEQSY